MDRSENGAHHRAGDRDLGKLEGDGAGVAHDAGADLDQLELEAGQRPVGHFLGQFDTAQEGCQVVGQHMQLQSHLVAAELPGGQVRIALGRKSRGFAGSERGGDRAAFMYTLIVNCKMNDIDPQAWMADVLARLPDITVSRLPELLPWNWKAEQKDVKAA